MLNDIKIENILFLDIETVPQYESYDELSDTFKTLWDDKTKQFRIEDKTPDELYDRAGIYAEFGKIICISVGFVIEKPTLKMRIRSFSGDDEKELLKDFFSLLNNYYTKPESILCAHNGKEFDFPYIARRGLINGLKLPSIIDVAGKKPWEVKNIDTLELWKFGDYKHYTSLKLLTAIFDIPSPKDDISGGEVGSVYYKEKNLSRIVTYCEKDVIAIAQLFLRYRNQPLIQNENIELLSI